jgi:hypothetical protein
MHLIIPPNLVEKFSVNLFFPGGAGSVAGEVLVSKYKNKELKESSKYLARALGSYLQYGLWTTFQYFGHLTKTIGPHGENIFEGPEVYPFNFLLATISILTPDIVGYVTKINKKIFRK